MARLYVVTVRVSVTFLAICLVGTENKAVLSRKADMRLQLRSTAWYRVMGEVNTHTHGGLSDVRTGEWKRAGRGQRAPYDGRKADEKCDEPRVEEAMIIEESCMKQASRDEC